jgi:hypothetical protein
LVQYAQLVRLLGKGTGKYAAQRRADIRAAMFRCREAVPVWIMPLYRIADQLDVTQNMFDVVVADEASQAGLEATFLQYLAPKIVVIGDDKQVSAAAVGIDQQQLRDLANMYLRDDSHRASWEDPKQSFFDEAVKRFGSRLTLLEHRRCVPEIIGLSNRIVRVRLLQSAPRPTPPCLTPVTCASWPRTNQKLQTAKLTANNSQQVMFRPCGARCWCWRFWRHSIRCASASPFSRSPGHGPRKTCSPSGSAA